MERADRELVIELANMTARAVLHTAVVSQIATLSSLMITLAEKGILVSTDVSVFATRTADMMSQNLGSGHQEGIGKEINGALQLYVDELLKIAETGAGFSPKPPKS